MFKKFKLINLFLEYKKIKEATERPFFLTYKIKIKKKT